MLKRWWSSYKWRFLPWLIPSLPARCSAASVVVPAAEMREQIFKILNLLNGAVPLRPLEFGSTSDKRQLMANLESECSCIRDSLLRQIGFCLEKRRSTLSGCGDGVFVSKGHVRKGQVACFYPGTIYLPGEPVLIQSLANPFVFRCADGKLIDGCNRRISRLVFKFYFSSCAHRDRIGPYFRCEMSWLWSEEGLANPFCIGQFVNNKVQESNAAKTDTVPASALDSTQSSFRVVFQIEDSRSALDRKVARLATLMKKSRGTLVYTGAGISTSASIPDYRGPNGVWTLAEHGADTSVIKSCDPTQMEPTISHMVLKELYKCKYVKHIVSQNCDGFHLRSGIPQGALSEIHGNMHIEVCTRCSPPRQFIRAFDVTEHTGYRRHRTARQCDFCHAQLTDTIVHFGEMGRLRYPLNWDRVSEIITNEPVDLILCLGSSLQVLKSYKFLWPQPQDNFRPKLAIVNLQWTPLDFRADLKIQGKCDQVLQLLLTVLNVEILTPYCRNCDPVLGKRQRSCRSNELLRQLSECRCFGLSQQQEVSSICEDSAGHSHPGWWSVGLKRTAAALTASRKRKSISSRHSNGKKRGRVKSAAAVDDWKEDSEDDLLLADLKLRLRGSYNQTLCHCVGACGCWRNFFEHEQVEVVVADLLDRVVLSLALNC